MEEGKKSFLSFLETWATKEKVNRKTENLKKGMRFLERLDRNGELEAYVEKSVTDEGYHEENLMMLALFLRKKIREEGLHGYTYFFDQVAMRWENIQDKSAPGAEYPYDIYD